MFTPSFAQAQRCNPPCSLLHTVLVWPGPEAALVLVQGAGVCPRGGSVPCPSPSPHTHLTSSPVLPSQLASNQPH